MTPHYTLKSIIIPLTRNRVTYIDPIDADLWHLNWYAVIVRDNVYAKRSKKIDGKMTGFYIHRIILSRVIGRELKRSEYVDHIDMDGRNNHRDNLRLSSHSENLRNQGRNRANKSGFKGVSWHTNKNKWRAMIQINGKRIELGHFDTPETAYEAYCKAAIDLHGKFVRLK